MGRGLKDRPRLAPCMWRPGGNTCPGKEAGRIAMPLLCVKNQGLGRSALAHPDHLAACPLLILRLLRSFSPGGVTPLPPRGDPHLAGEGSEVGSEVGSSPPSFLLPKPSSAAQRGLLLWNSQMKVTGIQITNDSPPIPGECPPQNPIWRPGPLPPTHLMGWEGEWVGSGGKPSPFGCCRRGPGPPEAPQ